MPNTNDGAVMLVTAAIVSALIEPSVVIPVPLMMVFFISAAVSAALLTSMPFSALLTVSLPVMVSPALWTTKLSKVSMLSCNVSSASARASSSATIASSNAFKFVPTLLAILAYSPLAVIVIFVLILLISPSASIKALSKDFKLLETVDGVAAVGSYTFKCVPAGKSANTPMMSLVVLALVPKKLIASAMFLSFGLPSAKMLVLTLPVAVKSATSALALISRSTLALVATLVLLLSPVTTSTLVKSAPLKTTLPVVTPSPLMMVVFLASPKAALSTTTPSALLNVFAPTIVSGPSIWTTLSSTLLTPSFKTFKAFSMVVTVSLFIKPAVPTL